MNVRKKIIYLFLILFLLTAFWVLYVSLKKKDVLVERVVIVTIDTLRADHMGSYGYIVNTTPFLDNIGKQGILLKNMFAATATTAPSHASLFTSLYPLQHGVLKNGHKLADSFLTMAEILQEMGYKTAGIVSTDRHFLAANIHQGFQYFNEPTGLTKFKLTDFALKKLKKEGVPGYVLEKLLGLENKIFPGETVFLNVVQKQIGKEQTLKFKNLLVKHARFDWKYRMAQETIDVALDWLDTVQPAEKFFLWIHLYDPHGPLRPPKDHLEKIENSSDEERLFKFLINQHHINFDLFNNNKADMLQRIKAYDAEIHYSDFELQRFFNTYQTRGFDTRSLLIITSDHGQGLGSHNWWGHGRNIYNEQIHVPLLFYFSSGVGKGLIIDRMVEHVDIFPTVLELLGGNTKQLKEIKGESLVPFIFSNLGKKYQKKYVFSQRRFYEPGDANKGEPGEKNRAVGEKYALQTRDYKYIYSTHEENEFFDLRNDPYELNNRVNSGTTEKGQLKKMLLAIIKYLKEKTPSKRLSVDKETIERLKSLGYVQ